MLDSLSRDTKESQSGDSLVVVGRTTEILTIPRRKEVIASDVYLHGV